MIEIENEWENFPTRTRGEFALEVEGVIGLPLSNQQKEMLYGIFRKIKNAAGEDCERTIRNQRVKNDRDRLRQHAESAKLKHERILAHRANQQTVDKCFVDLVKQMMPEEYGAIRALAIEDALNRKENHEKFPSKSEKQHALKNADGGKTKNAPK